MMRFIKIYMLIFGLSLGLSSCHYSFDRCVGTVDSSWKVINNSPEEVHFWIDEGACTPENRVEAGKSCPFRKSFNYDSCNKKNKSVRLMISAGRNGETITTQFIDLMLNSFEFDYVLIYENEQFEIKW